MSRSPGDRDGPADHRNQQASSTFTALFEQTHLPLLAYAVRRVAHPADAADIVAEAFLVAWRRIEEVPSGADARPWMFGVARGCLANYHRGERRRSALADRLRQSLEACHVDDPADGVDSTVRGALRMLTEGDRELMQLAVWEQLSRAEIAIALGCSQAAVRVRLHRARTRLRQAMTELDCPSSVPDPGSTLSRGRTLQLVPSTRTSTLRPTQRTSQEQT
jgi:RNA polymerase sigma-70 factor (ECF subfamily)